MPASHPQELMTIRDFAERYRVSVPTVYRLRARGELRIIKISAASRIRRVDAERWAAELPES